MPDAKTMAVNLFQSTKSVLEHLKSTGQLIVSEEKAEERMSICKTCNYFVAEYSRCSNCGCSMFVKTKLQAMKCPIGKW